MDRRGDTEVRQSKLGDAFLKRWDEVLGGIDTEKKSQDKKKNRVIKKLKKQARKRLWVFSLLNNLDYQSHNLQLLKKIRPLQALYPSDKALIDETKNYLRRLNRKAIEEFKENRDGKSNIIIMIIGCKKYINKLRNTIKKIKDEQCNYCVVGIVGEPNKADWKIDYDKKYGIFELPCSDGYEGLTEKVIWGCFAMELIRKDAMLVKADDDITSIEGKKIEELIGLMKAKDAKAAGSPISVKTPLQIDRGWHLGKSSGKKNWQAFEGIGPTCWMSGGAGYILMPDAVRTIGEFTLHSWRFIQSQIYEDLTVSWIIQSCCGKIHWIENKKKLGIKNERAEDIMAGMRYHKSEDLNGEKNDYSA